MVSFHKVRQSGVAHAGAPVCLDQFQRQKHPFNMCGSKGETNTMSEQV